jgi:hypothetical protein
LKDNDFTHTTKRPPDAKTARTLQEALDGF